MDLLQGLNDAQRLAVTTTEGPVMVMAGAGAGKTKVLTTRISYIIDELGINPYQILAVTFTNKAANEMKERVSNMLGIETKAMWISTFHSFASRLLRREIDALEGYTRYFTIIDDEDSIKIVKEILKDNDFDDKPKDMRHWISNSKNFENYTIKDPFKKDRFIQVLNEYNKRLKENNLLDFDDLIIKAIELFKENPRILEKYQNQFEYIMVDEFQDTNSLQYKLIFMLSQRTHNLFVVGDDFQSIYSFRGAKIENINKLRRDYLETKLILLERNYRSTTQILNLANCVIKNNPNQIKKVLKSNNKEGEMPLYYHADSSYDEVMFVIDKIKELMLKGYKYSDFAIMYRANYISRNFEDSLVKYQIPYRIYGGLSFFSRKEIKDMIAFLRLIVDSNDNFSFKRIINVPKRGVGNAIITKLMLEATERNLSLYDAIPYYPGKGQGANGLIDFKCKLDSIKASLDNICLRDLPDMILNQYGYIDELKADKDTYDDRLQNIKEFKSVLKEAEEGYEGESNIEKLHSLLDDLSLRSDNEDNDEKDAVVLTTYHQAKGLEFKTVFMVAMEEGIFPSTNSYTNEEIEEERRICYVGLTRAKEHLFITNSTNRYMWGQHAYMMPSRFLNEMDSSLYENAKKKLEIPKPKASTNLSFKHEAKKEEKPKASSNSYLVGDKVNHKMFGDGMVVAVNGATLTVAFKVEFGIKKLSANHPSIRKI